MRILAAIVLSFCIGIVYGQKIKVNPNASPESYLSAEELVKQVLLDGAKCASISNFKVKGNELPFLGARPSWGYFERNGSDFPFEAGIILTNGQAKDAEGPGSDFASSGAIGWTGDADASQLAGGITSYNATVFEFDFTPLGNEISFNYIFASEEYPDHACEEVNNFNDVFGFILSGPGIVNDPGLSGKNIALLPNGNPVTIDNVNNKNCGDEAYYVSGSAPDPFFQDIVHGGRTIILNAYSPAIPSQTYHVRLIIADIDDNRLDSAVFLEAGSFNLGIQLVDEEGVNLGDDVTVCENMGEYNLHVSADDNNVDIEWYFNDVLILGELGNSISVNQSGIYKVIVNNGDCSQTDSVNLTINKAPIVNNVSLEKCSATGISTFDLTESQPNLSNDNNVNFNYFTTQDGALNNDPAFQINNPNNYQNTQNNQIIYVKVVNANGCFSIAELTLNVTQLLETIDFTYQVCDDNGDNVHNFDLNTIPPNIVADTNGLSFEYYLTLDDAQNGINPIDPNNPYLNTQNPQTIVVKVFSVKNPNDCTTYQDVILEINKAPTANNTSLSSCSLTPFATFDLTLAQPKIANDDNLIFTYFTTQDGALNNDPDFQINNPNNYQNTQNNQIVYVRVVNANGCFSIAELTLNVTNNHQIVPDLVLCNDPDGENDETTTFDLTTQNQNINNALGIANNIITFYLNSDDALNGANPIPNPTAYINTSNPQTIYAIAINEGSCIGSAEFNLIVLPTPELIIPNSIAFCQDDEIREYLIDEEYNTYQWVDPNGNIVSNSALVNFNTEGTYTITVTEANNCPTIKTLDVIFDDYPVILNVDVNGNTVTVTSNGTLPLQYTIDGGVTWQNSYIFQNVPVGIYNMLVKNGNGCISEEFLFGVLGIPDVITPNDDGYNDTFAIKGIEAYPDATLVIFDRYGKQLTNIKLDSNNNWDGKYLGRALPTASYWYIIDLKNGKKLTGHITVKNR